MMQNRRNFLKGTSVACAVAATSAWTPVAAESPALDQPRAQGLAKGLTLLTIRQGGEYRLGVKTDSQTERV